MQPKPNTRAFRGRAAGTGPANRFDPQRYDAADTAWLDEPLPANPATTLVPTHAKTILNEVLSPDVGMAYSANPYQGCEHGCAYCYARPTHEFWGYGPGLDFERVILYKENAAELLAKTFRKANYEPLPFTLSGNTDCYQPAEARLKLTRAMLEVCAQWGHPVGLITKNSLIRRDQDLLESLARRNLVHVYISITTLDEGVRRRLEPRTATAANRLRTVQALADAGVPVGVMCAPVIPGLTDHEIPAIVQAAADAGALNAHCQVVRLNGPVGPIFEEWLRREFPGRADKIMHLVAEAHGGQVNDSRFHTRMRGEGPTAEALLQLFRMAKAKHFAGRSLPGYDYGHFCPPGGKQQALF